MEKSKIHIGTSGWSYPSWKGKFYPEKLAAADFLTYYAKYLHVTEINTTFYHLPRKTTVQGWRDKVPAGFLFCPKMSRYLTHLKRLLDPTEPVTKFFTAIEDLPPCGPVLLQLPPTLQFDQERAIACFDELVNFKGYTFALEIRHTSWLQPNAIELLKAYKIAFVMAESGGRWPSGTFVTSNHVYARFHGPNGDYKGGYSKQALDEYATVLNDWHSEGYTVWGFFNNTIDEHGIYNALYLHEKLGSSH
ncbi:uncharacterized protein YecE (DUF72 family) [Chitinophaga skermanii]|uniref:Uncharacterized protein YecE (DUF72 family) n=1 Tax=Chitinophaga skermanii TaxID=331697 RepID=A0A327QEC1_9BACT|nr:DUF72 domain-containing protein [Chitinophaga skermanii]RAJ02355.1 uncharacterized protein YecE (DUF72 family) [Chitinophaga skermanii]